MVMTEKKDNEMNFIAVYLPVCVKKCMSIVSKYIKSTV
jgi:hypothetical protein